MMHQKSCDKSRFYPMDFARGAAPTRGKFPIDRPCSACSDGDSNMEYHDHNAPFREGYGPSAPTATPEKQNGPMDSDSMASVDTSSDWAGRGDPVPVQVAPTATDWMPMTYIKFWLGKLANLAGYPAIVRECEYMGPLGKPVSVKVHELYTVISIGGLDVYFNRLTGKIDGTGFIQTADCSLGETPRSVDRNASESNSKEKS